MEWALLITNLSSEQKTLRMRVWRRLKASGAAALKDGVYLLPAREPCRRVLQEVHDELHEAGGNAYLFSMRSADDAALMRLFDRRADYETLDAAIARCASRLSKTAPADALKDMRALQRMLDDIRALDFFPGAALADAEGALAHLRQAIAARQDPNEPRADDRHIEIRHLKDYRNRVWATRRRPWVDRLASAWLIKRFIDPAATILWLDHPRACPTEALGFDFDGATFTHAGDLVSFEVICASFRLKDPGLERLAALVHYLDVGGTAPPEAQGVEQVLRGLRDAMADDDTLLSAANAVFDGLHAAFSAEAGTR